MTSCSKKCIILLLFYSIVCTTYAQQEVMEKTGKVAYLHSNEQARGDSTMRLMFYNVENLFEPTDDTITSDEEYQPEGIRGWSFNRMKRKQINIAKVILAVGGWEPPEVIGLCEIENLNVLKGLVYNTPLKNFKYRIIHYDSPDPRGIDVAFLYRPEKIKVLQSFPLAIRFPFDTLSRTRDVLYIKTIFCKTDTFHIFVNHWPSKYGGALTTIPKREYVASVIRNHTDSLLAVNPDSRVIILGDLNDSPYESSVKDILGAKMDSTNLISTDLYNLHAGTGLSWKKGTIKFREEWETIDHMIISKAVLLHTTPHSLHIFDAPFLLQNDDAWFGMKPFRSYYGATYIGGFSDHLPIYMDINLKK